MVPKDWTWSRRAEPVAQEFGLWGFADIVERVELMPGMVLGSDGSGGKYSSDPRRRSCTWGVALLDPDTVGLMGGAYGTLGGPIQTVNRAELYALLWIATWTNGDAPVFIDSMYVVRGVLRGPRAVHRNHKDLWCALWQALKERRGELQVHKVAAHKGADEVGLLPFLANHSADRLAAKAAAHTQDSDANLEVVGAVDGRAKKVLRRLVQIGLEVPPEDRASKEARAKDRRKQMQERGQPEVEEEFANIHGHRLVQGTGEKESDWGCLQCGIVASKKQWEDTAECGELHLPDGTGQGHNFYFTHGVWYCRQCGSWFERQPKCKSKEPCRRPTAAGKLARDRAEAGGHPNYQGVWPLVRLLGDCADLS
jgi:ribonuclease HI